jgi:hypothetical protein
MRSFEEVRLSLQRYIAEALPDPWQVVLTHENEVPDRPYAVVTRAGDATTDGLVSSPTLEAPMAVYAYPEKAASRKEAVLAEDRVAEALWSAFARGVGAGREMLVPLWHYGGVPAVVEVVVPPPDPAQPDVWRIGYGDAWTDPLPRRAQPGRVQDALVGVIPGGLGAPPRVTAVRLGGPYHLIDDGEARGRTLDEVTVQVPQREPVSQRVLRQGAEGPWRDPREFVTVTQVSIGGQDDDDDPTLRRVNVSMRVSWARSGRHVPAGPLVAGVQVRGTGI